MQDDGLRNLGLRSAAAVARIKDSKVLRARRTEPRLRHDRSKFPFQRLLLDLQAGRTLLEAFGSDLDVVRRVGYRDHASLILYPPATSRHGCVPLGPDAEMGTPPTSHAPAHKGAVTSDQAPSCSAEDPPRLQSRDAAFDRCPY